MTVQVPKKDLVVLSACHNGEYAIRGILSRYRSLGIREVTADFYVHPAHDPGVRTQARDFLRPFVQTHERALVLMDRQGCGRDELTRANLEEQIEEALQSVGWTVVAAIVIDPELEAWVWSDSPHVPAELGWAAREPDLRSWLQDPTRGFLTPGQVKPARPKEALEAALREARKPRSSGLYRQLARLVSLDRCTDPAFLKLKEVLRLWFPAGPPRNPPRNASPQT
jgi:hypothetical protein